MKHLAVNIQQSAQTSHDFCSVEKQYSVTIDAKYPQSCSKRVVPPNCFKIRHPKVHRV